MIFKIQINQDSFNLSTYQIKHNKIDLHNLIEHLL
jgi:hypothetical protein